MIASHRAGEITYYEELALTPDASADEIHDSYRAHVRLLHPDQQTDPALKDIAERQMRKLNRIHAVLSDPERRRRYDEGLESTYPRLIVPPRVPARLNPLFARLAWVGAVAVGAGLLWLLAQQNSPGPQTRPAEAESYIPEPAPQPQKPVATVAELQAQVAQLKSDLRAATGERDAAIQTLKRMRSRTAGTDSATGTPLQAPASASKEQDAPAPARVPTAEAIASSRTDTQPPGRFAGFWFYAKPKQGQHNKNRSLYLPEFIEATIRDDNGISHGRYRSRFLIADRAISPDVNFDFTGTAAADTLTASWKGPGGARGEVTMRLTSENQLRVDWTASSLGTQQALVSGTAMLTRRIE